MLGKRYSNHPYPLHFDTSSLTQLGRGTLLCFAKPQTRTSADAPPPTTGGAFHSQEMAFERRMLVFGKID